MLVRAHFIKADLADLHKEPAAPLEACEAALLPDLERLEGRNVGEVFTEAVPGFVVIGVTKGASTTFWKLLDKHPSVRRPQQVIPFNAASLIAPAAASAWLRVCARSK